MRHLLKFLLVTILLTSCSKDDNVKSEPVTDFKIFKQSGPEVGKVMEDKDSTYIYKAYGAFKSTSNPKMFIPKTIDFIEQTVISTGEKFIIKLDKNFMPQVFYKVSGDIIDGYTYHVFYGSEETLINADYINSEGIFTTNVVTVLPGLQYTTARGSSAKGNSDDCEPLEIEGGVFNICTDESIYKQFGDWFEEYSANAAIIRHVGKAVKWTVNMSKAKICNSPSSRTAAGAISCEDYITDEEDEDICNVLISCATDCTGKINGNAYLTNCSSCVGGTTGKIPLSIIWTAVYTGGTNCWEFTARATGGNTPYSYSWSNGSTSLTTITCDNVAGVTGYVMVTDNTGCTARRGWVFNASQ